MRQLRDSFLPSKFNSRKSKLPTSSSIAAGSLEESTRFWEAYQVEAASFGQSDITDIMRCAFDRELILSIPNVTKLVASPRMFHDDLSTVSRGMVMVLRKKNCSIQSSSTSDELYVLFARENSNIEKCMINKAHPIQSLKHPIEIITAYYGPTDVTKKCAEIIDQQDEISIHASNHVFTDTWPDVFKSMTIVYRVRRSHDGTYGPIRMKIVPEHEYITINPILEEEYFENIDSQLLVPRAVASMRQEHLAAINDDDYDILPNSPNIERPIQIIRAVYGLGDVTKKVKEYLNHNGDRLCVAAENAIFGDTWPGVVKYLHVFYKLKGSNNVLIASCLEHETLNISFDISTTNQDENYENKIVKKSKERDDETGVLQVLGAVRAQTNHTNEAKQLLETPQTQTKIYSLSLDMHFHSTEAPLVILLSIRGKLKLIISLRDLCLNPLIQLGSIYDKAHSSLFRASIVASRNQAKYTAFLRMNRKRQEILVIGKSELPVILMQNYLVDSKEYLFTNLRTNEQVNFNQLFSIVFRIKATQNGSIKLKDHLLIIENANVKFNIALFEVYPDDLLRNKMPCFIKRLVPVYVDGSIPDAPGLSFSPRDAQHKAVIQLHDIHIRHQ
ncbi:hypothetical protein C9374_011722 [Naegleria lovaniensis]|uniref:Uncharacterized protein n=1 Tax=Naegleria lovaniensis TaxID=51637 RepID=A0AA88KIE8_NAELO|nr:uncharacterized protein C9374_011722 [Naegleria lovaniensis]KAG2373837.1 hypothetical protein C9374_011722 [Naegleria lovaniensis]